MPQWLLQFAGALLLVLCVGYPRLEVLEIYARRRMDPAPPSGGPPVCVFCGRGQHELDVLIAGPRQYVCSGCVREASASLPSIEDTAPGGATILCSFCAAQRPVATLLVRGEAVICSNCAALAASVLDDAAAAAS